MALAEVEDVEAALGRDLTGTEGAQADALLEEASDLVIGYLGCEPEDPTPATVTRVVARMVARVFSQTNPTGATGTTQSVGPFSQTVQFASGTTGGNPWIASADKISLRPYRCGGGMRAVPFESAQTGRYRRYP